MATALVDFQLVKLPPIEEASELFGGRLHALAFKNARPPDLVAIGDSLYIQGRVPLNEDWQVLQVSCGDMSGPPPQGWKVQWLDLMMSYGAASGNPTSSPQPTGDMGTPEPIFRTIWQRMWDGATYIQWADYDSPFFNPLRIQPGQPVFSIHRWPAGSLWRLRNDGAEKASTSQYNSFVLNLEVLRLPKGVQGVDVRRPLVMLDAALRAVQESARREVLRG